MRERSPKGLDRAAAEQTLRAMHEHAKADEPIERIVPLIHPKAEMRLLVSFGEPLRGRDAVVAALEHGRQALVYTARVRQFEWLDEQTSLTSARARYALEDGGHAEGNVYWLDELRDGMIWRVEVFKTEAEARRAYEERTAKKSS